MPLEAGRKLGPYEVIEPIGKGGMGEVYRARDTKLDRDVAIKVLPEEFAQDGERLARFEREAKLLASLNHPNIASIYGFESGALVLELVEGPTLAERIAEGPIPVEEGVAIATQIAEALEAGHEAGVIHRDLKPANVKVKEDGTVKVLDYGLAKALEGDAQRGTDAELSQSPTLTRQGTQIGVILGTAAYMSPEQAKGKRVDKRTDVWAFGAVVFEMLSGRRPFSGETTTETLAAVLTKEPDWTALASSTPGALRRILRLCFRKDARLRLRSVADALILLEGEPDELAPRKAAALPWVAAVVASVLAGVTVWNLRPSPPRPLARFVATPPSTRLSLQPDDSPSLVQDSVDVAITPDGSRVVYAATLGARPQLVVRPLDELEATPITGLGDNPRGPFVSPDGNWVGYFDGTLLRKVSIQGGAPVTVCVLPESPRAYGASWTDNGTIVFAVADGIWQVAADGGSPERLTRPDAQRVSHRWPHALPGGEAVLFTVRPVNQSVDEARIAVLSLATGEVKVLVPAGSNPRFIPTGHIAYGIHASNSRTANLGTLWAVRFDMSRLEVVGESVPVLERIVTKSSGAANFGVADDGSLAYVEGSFQNTSQLAWVDRQGQEEVLSAPPRNYAYPRLSPDGSRLALDVRDQENDIWIWEFGRETLTRLTFEPGIDAYPAWTPDGLRVALGSGNPSKLFWKPADGTESLGLLAESSLSLRPQTFSPDGRHLVFRESHPERGFDLGLLTLGDGVTASSLLATEFNELNAELSHDGRYIAYQSNESGFDEVYVRPFPDVEAGKWQVSKEGGIFPVWSRNGGELFYMTLQGQIMSVPVQMQSGIEFGKAESIIDVSLTGGWVGRSYDVSPDGERFLIIQEGDAPKVALILVQNWFEELKRLVPTDN